MRRRLKQVAGWALAVVSVFSGGLSAHLLRDSERPLEAHDKAKWLPWDEDWHSPKKVELVNKVGPSTWHVWEPETGRHYYGARAEDLKRI
jgi:hypothetical protein